MGRFGFGKKSSDDDDSTNRSALFGRKNKSSDKGDNPYAQQSAEDPYTNMTSYQQARANIGGGPNSAPPPYSNHSGNAGAYGDNKYGPPGGGYGANRYGGNQQQPPPPMGGSVRPGGQGRPGGYGGLGDANNDDGNRTQLFDSGTRERFHNQQNNCNNSNNSNNNNNGYGQSGAAGGSYDGYGEQRQQTEEDLEEEALQNDLHKIKEIRNESLASTQRSLQMVAQATESGRSTLARLGAQSEMLHNTERNLDQAANQNRVAEERTKELKTLNRSMFAVHVSNPFTSKARTEKRDQETLERHCLERQQREATRRDAYASQQRMENTFHDLDRPRLLGQKTTAASAAEISKYAYHEEGEDPDEEDVAVEREIDQNLQLMSHAMGELNKQAHSMGREVEAQNKLIDRIAAKSDAVDDGVRMNREKLNRIR